MTKRRIAAFVLVLTFLTYSCGRGGGEAGDVLPESRVPELLLTVPSDALAVVDMSGAEKVNSMLVDSSSVISRLDLRDFRGHRAVLSYVYTGSPVPILALDAGKTARDTSRIVRSMMEQAEELGIFCMYLPEGPRPGRRCALILSPSESALPSVDRHIGSCSSILDAPGFGHALHVTSGESDFIYIRNSGLDKLLPRTFMSRYLPRRQSAQFLQSAADWTLLETADSPARMPVRFLSGDSGTYFANTLSGLDPGESRVCSILPRDTEFVLDIPVGRNFRDRYENYLDARSALDSYKAAMIGIKAAAGVHPAAWEKAERIQEVAVVQWNNRKVVLVRPAKTPDIPADVQPNPCAGFPAVLYGAPFSLDNDMYRASFGKWIVTGSEPDVEAFISSTQTFQEPRWPQKECRFVVYSPSLMLSWSKKGFILNVND